MEASRNKHAFELRLAQDAGEGVLEAWHEFVESYSGLVYSIVRRYLADFDEETWRDAYVEVLEYMHSTGLAQYDGRAALSTWVMTIARTRAFDRRRALCGRKRDPAWLAGLSRRDREIFRLHYELGDDVEAILQRFETGGERLTQEDVTQSLDRIEGLMDRRLRTRLAYDLQARTVGAASGSLLDFLDHARRENTAAAEALRPDLVLMERRTHRLLMQVERGVEDLVADERKVIELRFYRALTAHQIAAEMGLEGPRRAYSLINRAVANLGRIVFKKDPRGSTDRDPAFRPEGTHD